MVEFLISILLLIYKWAFGPSFALAKGAFVGPRQGGREFFPGRVGQRYNKDFWKILEFLSLTYGYIIYRVVVLYQLSKTWYLHIFVVLHQFHTFFRNTSPFFVLHHTFSV